MKDKMIELFLCSLLARNLSKGIKEKGKRKKEKGKRKWKNNLDPERTNFLLSPSLIWGLGVVRFNANEMNKLDDIVHKKKRGEERTENERNKIKKEKEKRKKKKRKKEKKKKRKTYIFASRNNKRVRFDFEILDPKLKITCQHWVSGE